MVLRGALLCASVGGLLDSVGGGVLFAGLVCCFGCCFVLCKMLICLLASVLGFVCLLFGCGFVGTWLVSWFCYLCCCRCAGVVRVIVVYCWLWLAFVSGCFFGCC